MINKSEITFSKYKFIMPRLIGIFFYFFIIFLSICYLVFDYNEGNNEAIALFKLFMTIVLAITVIIGVLALFQPHEKIYSFNKLENQFCIFEKATFSKIYKLYKSYDLDSITDVVISDYVIPEEYRNNRHQYRYTVENYHVKGYYDLSLKDINDNSYTLITASPNKSKLDEYADKIRNILSGESDLFEFCNSNRSAIENFFIALIITQLILYADILKRLLLGTLF